MNIAKLRIIQNEMQDAAVGKLALNNWNGTCDMITGSGKTFVAFKSLRRMLEEGLLDVGDKLLFTAERSNREEGLYENAEKFKSIFNWSPYDDFNIHYLTYNSARKAYGKKIKFLLADEVHDLATPENSKLLTKNDITYKIGLSATTKQTLKVGRFTKGYYYNKYMPIVYTLEPKHATQLGLMRPIKLFVYHHNLSSQKIYKAGSKHKKFMTTEVEAYLYWDDKINALKEKFAKFKEEDKKRVEQNLPPLNLMSDQEFKDQIMKLGLLRKKVLYNLPSKAMVFNKYLRGRLEATGKTLVFANGLELLKKCQITHVLKGGNAAQKRLNQEYVDMFDNNETNFLASYKIAEQGMNLDLFHAMALLSYDSKREQFIQRIGRARIADIPIVLVALVAKGTVEPGIINNVTRGMNIIKREDFDVRI